MIVMTNKRRELVEKYTINDETDIRGVVVGFEETPRTLVYLNIAS